MPLAEFRFVTERQLRTAMTQARPIPDDEWLNQWVPLIENEVERYLGRVLLYSDNIVEWFSPRNVGYILLDRRPVHEIVEVRYDPSGGFGQKSGTFGADTILTPGDDYYLQLDGRDRTQGLSNTGMLWRSNQVWGYTRSWTTGLLAPDTTPALGTVKVTYKGGYIKTNDEATNQIPGVVVGAICQAAGVWHTTMVQVGVMSSESVSGYSWSQILGFNLGDNQFASIRGMLTSLKSYRGGAGMTSQG